MTSQWVFIEPSDVWMFRDNKPFTAQQNFVARSMFPPTPMTMQGVIRSWYMEHHHADWRHPPAEVGNSNNMGELALRGPFVARRNQDGSIEQLFKSPLDLLYRKEESGNGDEFRLLTPADTHDFSTDEPFAGWRPLAGGGVGFKEAEGWLTAAQFSSVLNGDTASLSTLLRDDEVFQTEERVGLSLNPGRRAHEAHMFYHAAFIRLCEGVGLLVQADRKHGDWFSVPSGSINIGGESRFGRFTVLASQPALGEIAPPTDRLKVVLLTPAWFSNGWAPANWGNFVSNGTLVSAVIGKPQLISGWDLARNQPKPLRNFVPAGSVYYFEGENVTLKQPFTENPQNGTDFGAMGFGAVAVGRW